MVPNKETVHAPRRTRTFTANPLLSTLLARTRFSCTCRRSLEDLGRQTLTRCSPSHHASRPATCPLAFGECAHRNSVGRSFASRDANLVNLVGTRKHSGSVSGQRRPFLALRFRRCCPVLERRMDEGRRALGLTGRGGRRFRRLGACRRLVVSRSPVWRVPGLSAVEGALGAIRSVVAFARCS